MTPIFYEIPHWMPLFLFSGGHIPVTFIEYPRDLHMLHAPFTITLPVHIVLGFQGNRSQTWQTRQIPPSAQKWMGMCYVPLWNMCHYETYFRLAWCRSGKNGPFWHLPQISDVQALSHRRQINTLSFHSYCIRRSSVFITESNIQTNNPLPTNKQIQ